MNSHLHTGYSSLDTFTQVDALTFYGLPSSSYGFQPLFALVDRSISTIFQVLEKNATVWKGQSQSKASSIDGAIVTLEYVVSVVDGLGRQSGVQRGAY
jgi:hypothetical protein